MKFTFTNSTWLFCLLSFSLLYLSSCKKEVPVSFKKTADFDAGVALDWSNVFLEIEKNASGFRPGPAPRSLAYIGLAAYEACVGGMPEYNSLADRFIGLNKPVADPTLEYHYPTVLNALYASMLTNFFSYSSNEDLTRIIALENFYNEQYLSEVEAEVFNRSKAYGDAVADAFWEWSKTDAIAHDANLDPFGSYDWQAHYDTVGDWEPTFPGPGKPMFPFWGGVRTFAINEEEKLCPPPLNYSENPNSPYYVQALEVYVRANNPSYQDHWIAEFWSDDLLGMTFSPGPRWMAIADQVYANENANLETVIYCNAKLGMAMNDAAVSCWHSKYVYNVERPVSFIHRMIDPNFKTLLDNPLTGDQSITPSFPAYPSGHSTMGAAAAEVLAEVFGFNYSMTDRCHEYRSEFIGTPRTFQSFREMAEENAESRIPLGVHFRMDSEAGVDLGYLCGRRVNELPWK